MTSEARKADRAHRASALFYAIVALIAAGLGIGLLLFYVYQVPVLVQAGTDSRMFYVLLLPWGIASAAFLFGAMKSYARLTHNQPGTVLELGGPVVLFVLVVVGGFKLVPSAPETFDLTVRPRGEGGEAPVIRSGRVTIDLGHRRDTADIDTRGEANFKAVPAAFRTTTVKVLAMVDGYDEAWHETRITGNVIDLPLKRATPLSRLTGTITPVPGSDNNVVVSVDGGLGEGRPDSLGRFDFAVRQKSGERVRLKVYVNGQVRYDEYQTLPGPVMVPLE